MTRALVEIQNLTKVYVPSPMWMRVLLRSAINEPVTALHDVSFSVEAGTICAVVGPNGAGKSTLFRILTGLTTPTTGFATVCGRDATHDSIAVRRLVGFMPAEDRTLHLRFTCVENLLFHGRLQGIPERRLRRRIDEVLDAVGLIHARAHAGFALSSGMRARLQLARALLHNPFVLILDEPTGAVDPVAAYDFLKILQGVVAEQKVAVLLSSHRLEEIEALHDNIILLDQGKLVHKGDLDTLRQIWERPHVKICFNRYDAAVQAAESLTVQGLGLLAVEPPTLTLTSGTSVGLLLRLLDGQLDAVSSIAECRMPLRELLAVLLRAEGGLREKTAEQVGIR